MSYRENYQSWLNDARLPEACREELLSIQDDEKAIEYRFGGELEFGTAGMRGIIGCGMNMMNVFTVMRATQGLSMYIKTLSPEEQARGVVILRHEKEQPPLCREGRFRACKERHQSLSFRRRAPRAHALVCRQVLKDHRGHHDHGVAQSQGIQRL